VHPNALEYIRRHMPPCGGLRVLEVGSYNVNGAARQVAPPGATWLGLDLRPGPGVDIVTDARAYDGAGQYDLVVCAETLEHCADHAGIIACAARALRPGGLLILTAATALRVPHNDDGYPLRPGDVWCPVQADELAWLLRDWTDVEIVLNADDIYATARWPGAGGHDGH